MTLEMYAWRPLEDHEYDKLSLSEKMRHHQILALRALDRAGPMWRNEQPCKAGDLPDSWREWRLKAENHQVEAARLRGIIQRSDKFA